MGRRREKSLRNLEAAEMFISTMKKPSAFLPLAMSFTVLAVMLVHGAMTGFVREDEEGTAAHIFQILMPA